MKKLWLLMLFVVLVGCRGEEAKRIDITSSDMIGSYPIQDKLFVQGFTKVKDRYLIGTGLYGQSMIGWIDLETGAFDSVATLPDNHFGEGVTQYKEDIYQLTWKEGVVYQRSANTLDEIKTFSIEQEGWGITTDNEHLICSNGSSLLYFRDPDDLTIVHTLEVTFNGSPLDRLNELEWVDGWIYANVWMKNDIYVIDDETGEAKVCHQLDVLEEDIRRDQDLEQNDVLNGICHDQGDEFLLSGKNWKKIYRVKLPIPRSK